MLLCAGCLFNYVSQSLSIVEIVTQSRLRCKVKNFCVAPVDQFIFNQEVLLSWISDEM